jgi:hypothetical protein
MHPLGKSSPVLEALGVGAAVFAALVWKLLPADAVLSLDGFYHFTIARLMWETGPVVGVTWLPLTVLGEAGPDHHWLWHLLLAPFGAVEDPVLGMNACALRHATYCSTWEVRSCIPRSS